VNDRECELGGATQRNGLSSVVSDVGYTFEGTFDLIDPGLLVLESWALFGDARDVLVEEAPNRAGTVFAKYCCISALSGAEM